jgi:hypothetical protein
VITAIVILASIALAAAFCVAWLVLPGFRQAIERPKHSFQDHVKQYDRQCHEGADDHES